MKIIQTEPYLVVENCKGREYELRHTAATLHYSNPKGQIQHIYYFADPKRPIQSATLKSERVQLPKNRTIRENPRNGFLTLAKAN